MDPDIVASPAFVEASAYGKRQRELQRRFLLNDRSFYQPANGFGEICSYFLSFGCRLSYSVALGAYGSITLKAFVFRAIADIWIKNVESHANEKIRKPFYGLPTSHVSFLISSDVSAEITSNKSPIGQPNPTRSCSKVSNLIDPVWFITTLLKFW